MKKKLCLFLLTAIFLCSTASAITLDTAENDTVSEAVVLSDEGVVLASENIGKPGYNLLNGLTTAEGFDGKTASDYNVTHWGGTLSFIEDSETGNAMLLNGERPSIVIKNLTFEAERPVHLSYKYKTTSTGGYVQAKNGKVDGPLMTKWSVNVTNDSWQTLGTSAEYSKIDAVTYGGASAGDTMPDICFGAAGNASNVLIDDVLMVPYYKVSYNSGKGTGSIDSEYFYADTYTLLADTSKLNAPEGTTFAYWVDTQGKKITDTVTAVPGSDIELTAVYLYKKGAPGVNVLTGSTEALTFENNSISEFIFKNWNPSISSASIVDDTEENKALLITGHYINMEISGIDCEAERPMYLYYEAKLASETATGGWIQVKSGAVNSDSATVSSTNVTTGSHASWKSLNDGEAYRKIDVVGRGLAESTDKMPTIYFGATQTINDVLIDNLIIAPYYKLSFDCGEGAGEIAPLYFYGDSYKLDCDMTAITAPAGKRFSHWTDGNGNVVNDTVIPVPGKDIVLTAVWVDNAPESYEKYEIRMGSNSGIRFFASVMPSQRVEAYEYGFIVARNDVLTMLDFEAEDLTFELSHTDYTTPLGTLFTKGVAYENHDGGMPETDISNGDADDGSTLFTAVCTGINITNKNQLTTQLVVRPYLNINGVICYGTPRIRSFYEVAVEISESDSFEELPNDYRTYITDIINTCK